MYPRLLARIVYQVGRPAMFDGNMFLPETGTPIRRIERSRTRLAVWLPDPLTVATWMLKSLATFWRLPEACCSWTARSLGDMLKSLPRMKIGREATARVYRSLKSQVSTLRNRAPNQTLRVERSKLRVTRVL